VKEQKKGLMRVFMAPKEGKDSQENSDSKKCHNSVYHNHTPLTKINVGGLYVSSPRGR
jgi:hypothetical protein